VGMGGGPDAVRAARRDRGGPRPPARRLATWLAAGTLAVGAGCSTGGARASLVAVGKEVTSRPGTVVTVYGWRPLPAGAGRHGSGLELQSCRADRHAVVLAAGGFTVRTARGAVVQPGGFDFTAVGADCVTGRIFFDVPVGDEPQYALYRAGSKLLRWVIAPNRPPLAPSGLAPLSEFRSPRFGSSGRPDSGEATGPRRTHPPVGDHHRLVADDPAPCPCDRAVTSRAVAGNSVPSSRPAGSGPGGWWLLGTNGRKRVVLAPAGALPTMAISRATWSRPTPWPAYA
jgi:hypothetical protein